MITHAGDTSNLILDPDLDSYYLMDVTLLALPETLSRLLKTAQSAESMLHEHTSKSMALAAADCVAWCVCVCVCVCACVCVCESFIAPLSRRTYAHMLHAGYECPFLFTHAPRRMRVGAQRWSALTPEEKRGISPLVIGLAFLPPDKSQPGTEFQIRLDDGSLVTGTVVETPFYDPKAERQEK